MLVNIINGLEYLQSRNRKEGKAEYSLTITKPILQIDKVKATCYQFACEPYFASDIDQLDLIKVVVTPLAVIEDCYTISNKSSQDWNILKFAKDNRSSVFQRKWS